MTSKIHNYNLFKGENMFYLSIDACKKVTVMIVSIEILTHVAAMIQLMRKIFDIIAYLDMSLLDVTSI